MSVSAVDIYFLKALTNNDLASNGGRIGTAQIVDNTLNNLFPNITDAERVAGNTRYRKIFVKNQAAASGGILQSPKMWIGIRSNGDDYFRIKAGTDIDIQTAAEAYDDWAGAGELSSPAASGESSLSVDYDAANGVYSGEAVFVKVGSGESQDTVKALGPLTFIGNGVTFSISGEMNYNHSAGEIVSTVVDLDDLEVTSDSWAETSGSGTYDEVSYALGLYPRGSETDSWTLTFSSSTDFSVVGANTGSVGAGDTSTDFQPANGSSYYFKIDLNGWGGSWSIGDTITFNTVHSAKALWAKQVVPAGISSLASVVVKLEGTGESA